MLHQARFSSFNFVQFRVTATNWDALTFWHIARFKIWSCEHWDTARSTGPDIVRDSRFSLTRCGVQSSRRDSWAGKILHRPKSAYSSNRDSFRWKFCRNNTKLKQWIKFIEGWRPLTEHALVSLPYDRELNIDLNNGSTFLGEGAVRCLTSPHESERNLVPYPRIVNNLSNGMARWVRLNWVHSNLS